MRGTQWDIGYDEIFPGKLSENRCLEGGLEACNGVSRECRKQETNGLLED